MSKARIEKSIYEKAKQSRYHFYDSLAQALEEKNLTRRKFRTKTNITIDSYQRGDREKEPGLDTVIMIANYFDKSIDAMCKRSEFAQDTTRLQLNEAIRLFLWLADALEIDINHIQTKNILFSQFLANYTEKQQAARIAVRANIVKPDAADEGVSKALDDMIAELAGIPTGAEFRELVSGYAKRLLNGERLEHYVDEEHWVDGASFLSEQAESSDDDSKEVVSPQILLAARDIYEFAQSHSYYDKDQMIEDYFKHGDN